jgi:hypothetical protein
VSWRPLEVSFMIIIFYNIVSTFNALIVSDAPGVNNYICEVMFKAQAFGGLSGCLLFMAEQSLTVFFPMGTVKTMSRQHQKLVCQTRGWDHKT